MIEKMKFLSITGPKSDIDRVADVYLSKYEMHLENALSELNTVQDLKPFIEMNPYKDLMAKSAKLLKYIDDSTVPSDTNLTPSEAATIITDAYDLLDNLSNESKDLESQLTHYLDLSNQIEPFRKLNYDLNKILNFKFIKFRFGRIDHEFYTSFTKYVSESLNTIFYECDSDSKYVWGVYFVPAVSSTKIDAIYSSLHFERIFISSEYIGTPEESYQLYANKVEELTHQIELLKSDVTSKLNNIASDLLKSDTTLKHLTKNHDIRKLAACTKDKVSTNNDKIELVFYILCGWMTKKDADAFLKDIEDDSNIFCISEDGTEDTYSKPPTKLHNPKLFRPFEMFINMYGLPAYNEIDPTIFVAITYSFMFGMMFGDVGQGFCLLVGGFVLYKLKKMDLAAILSCSGLFSTIFGFLYGSIFGYENIINALWTKPMTDTMTVLMVSVGFGVFLILIAMVINILNGIRSKDIEKIFFDTNGVAGLIFYVTAILSLVLAITGHALPAGIILGIFLGIPLLLIFFKEPLTKLIKKQTNLFSGSKGMYMLESFFELFEVLLSYITNTVSFVRVGAFALSHAGMMEVILMLGKATESEPNFIIIVLGNIFVACLEGLIVGIQVLRLEYYEMFSRFYKGGGKPFKPYKNK